MRSPHFGQPGWLCDRWAAWRSGEGFEGAEVVALEAWLVVPEAPDRDAELFGAIPQDVGSLSPGALRVNTTLRRRRFSADAISALLPQMAGAERELFAARFRGDVRVGEVTEEVARAFEGGGDPQTLEALLLDGVLVFEPLPQVLP